jgi:trk system potassium uptake protein TrkA
MRVLILGCGRLGAGLAQRLSGSGHTVTIIDPSAAALARLPASMSCQRLVGAVLDRRTLAEAAIERQDGLAAVTPSDDTNIVAARLARLVFHVPRVIARIYHPEAAAIYQRLGIQTVCTVSWGISRIAELLSYSELEPVASLGSGMDLLRVAVPPLLVGHPVSSLTRPGEIQVAAIERGGASFLPQPATRFEAGDLLYLIVLAAAADQLVTLLRQ